MDDLSINRHRPLWQGGQSYRALGDAVNDYTHEIKAVGGYWRADYTEVVGLREAGDYILNGLGQHITTENAALDVIWEGFINKLTITIGAFSWVIGPMLDATNRTFAEYNLRDPLTGSALSGGKFSTEMGDNFDAQERYGIIEGLLSTQGADEVSAYQIRDSFLAKKAWPTISQTIGASGKDITVKVECWGYVRWLEHAIYNQTAESGEVFLEEKLKSALLAEPNGFFEMNVATYTKELLSNGNFEEAGAGGADIWASWTETVGDGTLTDVTSDHKQGSHCCGQTAGASKNTLVYQDVTVVPGQAYRLVFYSKDMSQESVSGNHDGLANSEFLEDSSAAFKDDGVKTGYTVSNTTDGSTAVISAIKETIIYGELSGGTDNDWDVADAFTIVTGAYPARYRIYDVTNAADIVETTEVTEFGRTTWYKTTVLFYAPEGCTSVRVYLMCADEDTKEVRFDAVSLREWSEPMAAHTTLVPAYEDRNRTAWNVIKELLSYGDYLARQYNWGVYADREVRFEVAPEEHEYVVSVSDVAKEYRYRDGRHVGECNVLPGKWLLITGILVGQEYPTLRQDPRVMWIDSIRYNARTGVALNPGKYEVLKEQLARLGLQEL